MSYANHVVLVGQVSAVDREVHRLHRAHRVLEILEAPVRRPALKLYLGDLQKNARYDGNREIFTAIRKRNFFFGREDGGKELVYSPRSSVSLGRYERIIQVNYDLIIPILKNSSLHVGKNRFFSIGIGIGN